MFEGIDFYKMGDIINEAQKKVKEFEKENENLTFSAKSGGGLVNIVANGKGDIVDLSIDDSLLEDKESMQILIISAINDVIKMVEDNKKQIASKMLGGLGGFGA